MKKFWYVTDITLKSKSEFTTLEAAKKDAERRCNKRSRRMVVLEAVEYCEPAAVPVDWKMPEIGGTSMMDDDLDELCEEEEETHS